MLRLDKEKCGNNDITTIETLPESHLHWKERISKNPLYFWIYADFEADNEKDNSSIGNKTTSIYKQSPVPNGYRIISELEDASTSWYHKPPLGYIIINWFVNEVKKIEIKMAFYFKFTNEDNFMTEKDEEYYRKSNICRFCEEDLSSEKVRDHCHLTGGYRGPAHSKCSNKVTPKTM